MNDYKTVSKRNDGLEADGCAGLGSVRGGAVKCLLGSLSSVELFKIYYGETKTRIWLSRSALHPAEFWLKQVNP